MKLVLTTDDGAEVQATVHRDGSTYSVELEGTGRPRALRLERRGASLIADGRQREISVVALAGEPGAYVVASQSGARRVEVADPLTRLAAQSRGTDAGKRGGRVTAYMPGRVVSILVEPGTQVAAGQGLVVLEAMKMQNEIQAERPGVVKTVHVVAGQSVDGGDLLFEIE